MDRRLLWLLCSPMLASVALGFAYLSRHPLSTLVAVVPLGEMDDNYPELVVDLLVDRMQLNVRLDLPRPLPEQCWRASMGRYSAQCIMDVVKADFPGEAWKAVVVTQEDLISEEPWEISPVVGLAHIQGTTAVVSVRTLERLSFSPSSFSRRFSNLTLHELGHALGLHHCGVGGCVMTPSQGDVMAWADLRSGDYCLLCRLKLGDQVLRPLDQMTRDWNVRTEWSRMDWPSLHGEPDPLMLSDANSM